jgi:hypothetical protein
MADILYPDNGGNSGTGYKDLTIRSPCNSKAHSALAYRQAFTFSCSLDCGFSAYSSSSKFLAIINQFANNG